ncbi:MAG: flavin reductase [Cellulosilyticaceae bacterium]
MDNTALFTIPYGVYILGTELNGKKNACVINTLSQVTQEPVRVSVTVLKTNLTHDMIKQSNKFSVSVLGKHASLDTIARFGFQSGRTVDKLEGFSHEIDSLDNPVITVDSIATMSSRVIESLDLGTHTLFIGEVIEARKLDREEPMTYAYYRDLKTGKVAGQNLEKDDESTYQCSVCHYVYDGDMPFEELSDNYVCPLCNQPKSVFTKK